MRIVSASCKILDATEEFDLAARIERAGRVCYQSQDYATLDSAQEFVRMLIRRGHESVLEHEKLTVSVICDRATANEWVRHRIASYSQESTRYCDYTDDRFGGELTFIAPMLPNEPGYDTWKLTACWCEASYHQMISKGVSAEIARSVLPLSLKTELTVTMNLREWRHFFKLRTTKNAHPLIRGLARNLLKQFMSAIPCFFEDINEAAE